VRSIELQPNRLEPIESIDIRFSEAVDPASLSISDDVLAISNSRGADPSSRIAGISWIDASTVRIHFATLTQPGDYQLTLGPNITAADDGRGIDNDLDGIVAEANDDAFVARISYAASIGPEGAGLSAAPQHYEPIDLRAGQPGLLRSSAARAIWAHGSTSAPTRSISTARRTRATRRSPAVRTGCSLWRLEQFALEQRSSHVAAPRSLAVLWDDWRPDIDVPGQQQCGPVQTRRCQR